MASGLPGRLINPNAYLDDLGQHYLADPISRTGLDVMLDKHPPSLLSTGAQGKTVDPVRPFPGRL